MNELDIEILKAKQKVKDLRECKKHLRKLNKFKLLIYKPPVYFVVNDIWDSMCYTFLRMVGKHE